MCAPSVVTPQGLVAPPMNAWFTAVPSSAARPIVVPPLLAQ
jgi:hypothetical protein